MASGSRLPYYRLKQRLTHGSAMWADTAWLKAEGFAKDFTTSLTSGELRLGTLPTGHQLVLPPDHTMRYVAMFGPPGSGNSATFITTFLRNCAKCGSTIVLDPKGELFEQTASHYQHAFRLDLMDPSQSDLGVGRGRKVAVLLAYQNLGQVYAHYGRDGGDGFVTPMPASSPRGCGYRPHLVPSTDIELASRPANDPLTSDYSVSHSVRRPGRVFG